MRPLKVFLNYRHDDAQGTAWAVYIKLVERFGAENVFFDNGTLKPGMPWFDEIKEHVAAGGVFIALLGPRWLSILKSRMQRGEDDYVAKEIDLAFQTGPRVNVIPVLVEDAELPIPSQLPPSVRALSACHFERLTSAHFLGDMERLIRQLEGLRRSPTRSRAGAQLVERGAPDPSVAALDREHVREVAPRVDRLSEDEPGIMRHALVPPPGDDHYETVVRQLGNLVVLLGAGANADEYDGAWQQGRGLPDDTELARYLASKVGLMESSQDLAAVAQYASAMYGEPEVFGWLSTALRVDSEPGPLHRYLARLPTRLRELGLEKRYQMIVTPKYDAALERAFNEAHEPFDVAVYVDPGTDEPGRFVHVPWNGQPTAIAKPNDYFEFPINEDGRLSQTVIVRVYGAVEDRSAGFIWENNYVITQDDYIDYLSGRPAEEAVPAQILATLRRASYLFLGYALADWRLRVFLRRIRRGQKLGRAKYWAIERDPDRLEIELCQEAGVKLYGSGLIDYVERLDSFLTSHVDQLRP